ncbi:sirohydrochlorin chelatase, partial [Streptomyces anulatus]|nr:sirohydrochlorin chelatase [Streptomyces anulatus]
MTEQTPERPHRSPPTTGSTARLLTRTTDRLSLVPRNGTPGPMDRTRQPDRPAADGGPPAPSLVAVAHGSRDPEALRTALALLDLVRDLRP